MLIKQFILNIYNFKKLLYKETASIFYNGFFSSNIMHTEESITNGKTHNERNTVNLYSVFCVRYS